MNAGVELRLARVKRGLSREDVASRTKITPAMLEVIEDMQIDRLPATVYLRGFLRSYASEVGLAADRIVERYLVERDSASQALTAFNSETTVLETVVALKPPVAVGLDAFVSETTLGPASPALPGPTPAADVETIAASETEPVVIPPAFVVPGRTRRALGRIAALAAGLALAVTSMLLLRSLSSTTRPVTLAAMRAASAVAPPEAIEARNVVTPAVLHAGVAPELAAVDRAASDRIAAVPAVVDASELPAMLSGQWTLTNEVQSTSFKAFEGLQLEYRLTLSQDGVIVTGRGQKWSENGREVPSSRRTPISVAGTLYQNRLELSFTERGTRRTSAGRFVWQISDDGALRGTFSSDAASSRGTSYARRMQ